MALVAFKALLPYLLSYGAVLATLARIIVSTAQELARASTVEWTLALLRCFAIIAFLAQCYFIYVKFKPLIKKRKAVTTTERESFRFGGSLPHPDYIQRLIKRFCVSPSPECMRRVVFNTDNTFCEYVSASFLLPGAYIEFFPCPHCRLKDEEGRTSFVEVFHLANVHEPNVCATVTIVMPPDYAQLLSCGRVGRSVEVEFTKGCRNVPTAADHSNRTVLPIVTDVCIEVLRFLPRSELEKMLFVSRRLSNVIGWAAGTLQQRRSFSMILKFYGVRMLSVHFVRNVRPGQFRTLRLLTTRGLPQALEVVRSHLQNVFVDGALPDFYNAMPPGPPRELLVDIPLPRRFDWLKSLLCSMPRNSEITQWNVRDTIAGFNNLPALASCALESHRNLGCVQSLVIGLQDSDATWAQLASLLNDPGIRGFSEIIVSNTSVTIDTSELRAILSSWRSLKLSVTVSSEEDSQDALLAMPAQLIRDFLAIRDVNSFVAEFVLILREPDNIVFPEMPDVHEATDRRKRFRYHIYGEDTVVRVRVYKNRAAGAYLSVATFDHFRRTVLFLNGNVSLADLKLAIRRYKGFR